MLQSPTRAAADLSFRSYPSTSPVEVPSAGDAQVVSGLGDAIYAANQTSSSTPRQAPAVIDLSVHRYNCECPVLPGAEDEARSEG